LAIAVISADGTCDSLRVPWRRIASLTAFRERIIARVMVALRSLRSSSRFGDKLIVAFAIGSSDGLGQAHQRVRARWWAASFLRSTRSLSDHAQQLTLNCTTLRDYLLLTFRSSCALLLVAMRGRCALLANVFANAPTPKIHWLDRRNPASQILCEFDRYDPSR
jgi:hypothetical protein